MGSSDFLTGLDALSLENITAIKLKYGRCALVSNQASVSRTLEPAWSILRRLFGSNLTTLFGPQHGFESLVQDNMIETDHGIHEPTGLPVYSLYSETREPSEKMLANVDTIVVDLQISGCRIYTYKYTLAACLRAAKKYGKQVLILDRPNPLGGLEVEGNLLDLSTKSFVGEFRIPMRHGLTLGECGELFNKSIGASLSVIKMINWRREMLWPDLNRPWVLTSPNMSIFNSCLIFPGMVLFEGTNLSEGRGTTLPFLLFGAPYLNAEKLKKRTIEILGEDPPGIFLRPASFQPNFSKWSGKPCQGVELIPTEPKLLRSFRLALALLKASIDLGGKNFSWREPPYEYEEKLYPIEILSGIKGIHQKFLEKDFSIDDSIFNVDKKDYAASTASLHLYD